jgi:chromosome partitioning protein
MATILMVGTSKGGSGKTTLSILIAGELANQGYDVLLIDTDPQGSISKWHRKCEANKTKPNKISVVSSSSDEKVTEYIHDNGNKDIIILDTGGFASNLVLDVSSISDLLIVPCKISSLDADEAIEFIQMLHRSAERLNVPPPQYKVVLNEYDPIAKSSKSFENVYRALTEANIVVSNVLMQKRERFKLITEGNGSLYQLPKNDKATESAQINVRNLVYDLFNSTEA